MATNKRSTYRAAPILKRRTRLVWNRAEILATVGILLATLAFLVSAWSLVPPMPDAAPVPVPVSQVGTDTPDDATPDATPDAVTTLDPCPTEDSSDCYWDATHHGNGTGRSWVNVNGVTYYLNETGEVAAGTDATTGTGDTGTGQARP